MSRIIGDRKENTLDEMLKNTRQFNADVAEEERLRKAKAANKAKEKAARKAEEAENPKAPAKPLIIPASGIGDIEYDAELITGKWASCVSQAKAKNLEIATARQIAELRMHQGRDSVYCTNGCWVAESFNYLPSGDILVASADYNPLLRHVAKATNKHDAGKEFYLDDRIVAMLLKAEKNGGVLMLNRKDVPAEIQVDAFGKEPLTAFLGWNKDYGDFLKGCGIETVKLYFAEEAYAKKQKKAFSRALWAYNLSSYSALGGNYNVNINGRAFGVSRSAKNSAGTGDSQ